MGKFFENITDMAKFVIMLVIYTGYMTWWASGVTHDLRYVNKTIDSHVLTDELINHQTIVLAESVKTIQAQQAANNATLKDFAITHAKCAQLMESLMIRMDHVEEYNGSSR